MPVLPCARFARCDAIFIYRPLVHCVGRRRATPMILTVGLLPASAAIIYLSCEYFVGQRFGVSRGAVGTVLAAFVKWRLRLAISAAR